MFSFCLWEHKKCMLVWGWDEGRPTWLSFLFERTKITTFLFVTCKRAEKCGAHGGIRVRVKQTRVACWDGSPDLGYWCGPFLCPITFLLTLFDHRYGSFLIRLRSCTCVPFSLCLPGPFSFINLFTYSFSLHALLVIYFTLCHCG